MQRRTAAAFAFALFATPIGSCGIVWGPRGIIGVQLPESSDAATRARVRRRFPGAVESVTPVEVQRAVDGITALLRGEKRDLADIGLDLSGAEPFHQRVYEVARTIAPGCTMTYGEIAKQLGQPRAAQAVGVALAKNPVAIIVPCHRVLAAGGKLGGFSANGGVTTKRLLLEIEGARLTDELTLFDPPVR